MGQTCLTRAVDRWRRADAPCRVIREAAHIHSTLTEAVQSAIAAIGLTDTRGGKVWLSPN